MDDIFSLLRGFSHNVNADTYNHFGILAEMCEELKIAESIDHFFPNQSPDQPLSIGQTVVAIMLNGLYHPDFRLTLSSDFFNSINLIFY